MRTYITGSWGCWNKSPTAFNLGGNFYSPGEWHNGSLSPSLCFFLLAGDGVHLIGQPENKEQSLLGLAPPGMGSSDLYGGYILASFLPHGMFWEVCHFLLYLWLVGQLNFGVR